MSSTRIPATEISGLYGMVMKKASQKMLGSVPESLGVMWHHKPVLKANFTLGRKSRSWNECDLHLKSYAHMAVASLIGCSFCLDFGYFQANNEGLDLDKARDIPRWRESSLFSPLEREVLEYAEAMSQTTPTVTDEMSAHLLDQLGAPALIELTAFIGMANQMARTNAALGIGADGLASSCGLAPMAPRSEVASSA